MRFQHVLSFKFIVSGHVWCIQGRTIPLLSLRNFLGTKISDELEVYMYKFGMHDV